ncbi:MAG TPA: 2-oxoacid:acceptor oxidoreductase family protein [Deltaproteobacteria bacterium]|nr:2-oxoacid:acceptor oxidoreductase family protein [Deltaproteobacteria bacterium]HPR55644.1 2-oxoacid:acceptor oxidoreductase family protein [Deltaproteobacteria bacterium]HXK47417.1 2-oxoacid:acceptor oxidoreductase family protein [Deltaproteobacteria bacterium]
MDTDQVNRQIFMVGTGGQGILLLARALSELAVRAGRRVISSETHGMAMRGGTVTANLKVGAFESPLIPAGSADMLIGLDETEAKGYLHMLRPGGVSAVNAPEQGSFDHSIDATSMALNAKMPGAVNMVMLGFAVKILGIDPGEARRVVEEISPGRGLKDNLRAMEMGYAYQHQESA